MLLILEDDAARVKRFRAALRAICDDDTIHIWRSAQLMMREAAPHLSHASLISLDHDLDPISPGDDSGDGLDAVRWLVAQRITCPVIVHTSNIDRGRVMIGELQLAGIPCSRVLPFGDDWIEREWVGEAKRLARW